MQGFQQEFFHLMKTAPTKSDPRDVNIGMRAPLVVAAADLIVGLASLAVAVHTTVTPTVTFTG